MVVINDERKHLIQGSQLFGQCLILFEQSIKFEQTIGLTLTQRHQHGTS
jgi:hypothetical protein